MTTYFNISGMDLPSSIKSDMNTIMKRKLGITENITIPPDDWASFITYMKPLPEKSASGAIAHFSDGADTVPLKSLTYRFTPTQSGTGDPSPSNPRPIVPVTTANVVQTEKNLLNNTGYFPLTRSLTSAYYMELSFTNTRLPKIELEEGVTYTLSLDVQCDNEPFNFTIGAGDGRYLVDIASIGNQTSGRIHLTFTPTSANLSAGAIMAIRCPRYGTPQDFSFTIQNVQLEVGNTATTYAPYHSTTHEIDFGTVYGGEGDESGSFTNKYKTPVKISSLNWTKISGYDFFQSDAVSDIKPVSNWSDVTTAICEVFKPVSGSAGVSTLQTISQTPAQQLRLTTTDYATKEELLAAIGDYYITYELATPTTSTVDPVAIDSFYGVNNVFMDIANSSIELEYRADPTLATQ